MSETIHVASSKDMLVSHVNLCKKMLLKSAEIIKWRFLQKTLHTTTEQRYFTHQKSFKYSEYHILIRFVSGNLCLPPTVCLNLLKIQTETSQTNIFW